MTDLQEAGELATGELVDNRYRLVERIGEGAMARVYRAEDAALRRTVALKVLRGTLDGEGSVERALSETTLLAALNHHSLVTLFDARISTDEPSYLVMEYVEGITLRECIARGPVDAQELASIAVDIAEGLHVAHSAGIVHRDIKPSNILLWRSPLPGREWRAKVVDFGIAYLLDSPRVTTPGLAIGTAAYIAPEQARGETPAQPADIYAFGIMLIEALTGTRPFAEAEGIGTVVARLTSPPTIPDTLDPAWQGLLRGMTAMRPDDRPTALEVAVTAARLAAGDAAAAVPATVDEPTAALASETRSTAVLPVPVAHGDATAATTAFGPPAAAAASAPSPPEPARRGATSDRHERRRRILIGAVIAAVVLILAIAAAVWSTSMAGAPEPDPIPSTVVEPSVEPSIAPTEQAPAPSDDDSDDDGDTGQGNDDDDDGGNDNSGPGNNNGNGGGNGNGNGGGNGNGNGNGND